MLAIIRPSLRDKLFWLLVSICAALAWTDAVRHRNQEQAPSITVIEGETEVSYPVFKEESH